MPYYWNRQIRCRIIIKKYKKRAMYFSQRSKIIYRFKLIDSIGNATSRHDTDACCYRKDDIIKINADISPFARLRRILTLSLLLSVRSMLEHFEHFELSPESALVLRKRTTPSGIYRYRVIEAGTGLDKENVPPWGDLTPREAACLNRAISASQFVPVRINQSEIRDIDWNEA